MIYKTQNLLLERKMSYPEQFLYMVYDILSIAFRKKKCLISFSLHNILNCRNFFWFAGGPNLHKPPPPFLDAVLMGVVQEFHY